jgi:hypothetical protein
MTNREKGAREHSVSSLAIALPCTFVALAHGAQIWEWNVSCGYRSSDGYQCGFGFDLRSGKSIGGLIC